jgi:hypothetical protein
MPFAGDSKLLIQVNASAGELVTMSATIDYFRNITLTANQPIGGRVLLYEGYNGWMSNASNRASTGRYKYTFSSAQ